MTGCASTEIEIGPTFLSQEFAHSGTIIVTERVADKYDFRIGHIGEQIVQTCERADCIQRIERNGFVSAGRYWEKGRFQARLSAVYMTDLNRVTGAHWNVGVMVGWKVCENLALRLEHISNHGTQSPDCDCGPYCGCGYNMGQDAILLAIGF